MAKILQDEKVPIGIDIEEYLARREPDFSQFRILKKSVDARGKKTPHWVMTIEVFGPGEEPPEADFALDPISTRHRPIIIGSGPAGLFAALRLAERGVPCLIFERGSACEKRILAINRFWRYNEMNPEDNVCFGEGGAGLYSDGKLITRIKSPYIPYVMNRFVQFGAPPEIEYLSNPHVGSDKIRRLIPKIRQRLIDLGCEIHFNARVQSLLCENQRITGVELNDGRRFQSPHVVLATGHSASDIFTHLQDIGVAMEGKSFAMGLRIEHPQSWVNKVQFRGLAEHPELGAANYKLTYQNRDNKVGIYSFCMCPGGYVLSSGTEAQGVVCNGMSNYRRNSAFANAAIVVSIDHQQWFGSDTFGGLEYRAQLEHQAWQEVQNNGDQQQLPAQQLVDFLNGKKSQELRKGSSPSGHSSVPLHSLFPDGIYLELCQAFENFQKKMPGFIHPEAIVYGVESRTSCPIRITRDPHSLQSKSHPGLYPCGEGAGYAGGITSAGCDGVRVAEALCKELTSQAVT